MDVKDLMIGDYVRFKNDNIECVLNIFDNKLVDLESAEDVRDTDISPIKLTGDILKLNGFSLDEIASDWSKDKLVISGIEAPYYLNGVEINYVHELQNVARILKHDLGELRFPSGRESEFKYGDLVVVRNFDDQVWALRKFDSKNGASYIVTVLGGSRFNYEMYNYCIPYNEKTFRLVETNNSYDEN